MSTITTTPITKIWIMSLKDPSISPSTDPAFQDLLRSVLTFCQKSSGPTHSGHYFYQDTDLPRKLVMISGYPSAASNLAADKEYIAQGYLERMFKYVDHERLMQIEMSVTELPLEGEMVVLGTGELGKGVEGEEGTVVKVGTEIEAGVHTKEVKLTFMGDGREEFGGNVERLGQGAQVMQLRKISS